MLPTTVYVHLRLPRLRRLLEGITILPIVIPPVVLIVGVLALAPGFLKATSLLLALEYVILAMPFAYRAIDAGLRALDLKTLVEASSSLGAGWVSTLWRVVLPNLRTALLSAVVLTVALVLGEQRVALARALAIEPRVLLLDEPLSALDAKVRLQLREQIRALQQRLGTTTLFVTHDQEEALSMADRVGVMREGRLEQIAAPDELYTDPATAFVAEFVGVMNRIPGELRPGGQVTALGSTVPVRGHCPDETAVDVLVRPEGLTMEVAENGNGIVTTRTFLGSVTRVGVQLSGDAAVQVDRPSAESAALAPGASVSVSLPAQPVLVAPRQVS